MKKKRSGFECIFKGNHCLVGEGVAGCEGLLEEGDIKHLI